MATTIKDIAHLAGVSYGTVSRVLNNRPDVSPKTRAHILQIVKDLDYQPNAIARSLVTRQTYTIALMVPDISAPFYGGIALSVDKETFAQGYTTLLFNTDYDMNIEKRKLQSLQDKRVDGIIIKPAMESSVQFTELHLPTVLLSHIYEGEISCIDIENTAGGEIAGEHVAACGYRNVAFIGGYEDARSTQQRLQGFRSALANHGIALLPDMIRFGKYSLKSGYAIMSDLLHSGFQPDCVFCGNDLIALGVMQKAREAGISIPHKLGVVGFDDGVMAGLPQIQLTTIAQPVEQMGFLAADMLIHTIQSPDTFLPQKITLRPELVVRNTTCTV